VTAIQLLSDLHLEHHRDAGHSFINSLDPEGVDVLVLAGDICAASQLHPILHNFCDLYPQVVFVAGNHEFYHASVEMVTGKLHKLDREIPNLTWLDCKVAKVAGLRFVGGTLWYPKAEGLVHERRHAVNDFNIIKGFEPWVYQENQRCEALLQAAVKTADVVVTHHTPSRHGVAPQYRGSPINHFFTRDLTDLIERDQPPLWLSGHTHTPTDYTVGATRLACNPFGYPWEAKRQFREKLVIEVGPRGVGSA